MQRATSTRTAKLSQQISRYADSWNQVISDSGVDETFFQEHAVYKVESLEPGYQQDLAVVKELTDKLHRSPLKKELPSEIKERIISRCGSYRNVLYQLEVIPVKKRKLFPSVKTGAVEKTIKGHKRNLQNCYYEVLK